MNNLLNPKKFMTIGSKIRDVKIIIVFLYEYFDNKR